MTPAQRKHYLKGGKFLAKYRPKKTHDLLGSNIKNENGIVIVHQNVLVVPLSNGQYRFSCDEIIGWIPEEDLIELDPIMQYIEYPHPTIQYCYRMTYDNSDAIFQNFGKAFENYNHLVVFREYSDDNDNYIMKLSKPQAALVEKRVIDLMDDNWDKTKWIILFKENK